MNANSCATMDYENKYNWTLGQSKPNQTQFPKSQNERKLNFNKGLQKKDDFVVRINKPNFVKGPK